MGIKHVFVSHAAEDASIATDLAGHLRNAGHDAKVDTQDLALGDNAIEFMSQGIANAAAVVILFSRHTAAAKWQKLEIDAAVWNQVARNGGQCIVVRLDDTQIPPILGPKVYGRLNPGDRESLKKLVEDVCGTLFSGQTTSSLVAEAFRPDSMNPFRHLRAEFFENQPELHAKTFALPEAIKVGALEDMKPCILEGSRGTGKSMLLLSLRARNFLQRRPSERTAPQRFGFYLKLTRGAICNAGTRFEAEHLDSTVDADVLTDVAAQELMLQMTESLFSELAYCAGRELIDCGRNVERSLCEAADELLFDSRDGRVVSFVELQLKLSILHKRLAEFIRRRFIYQEDVSVPIATFDMEQFKRVVLLVRRSIPSLDASMFVVLLDEYENLFFYQQRIVNSLLKLGPPHVSVKIAKKLASGDTPGTTTGQELQEIHDYTRVSLVYNYLVSEYVPLSFGLASLQQTPGFSACPDLSRPVHLVMFLGYEGDRALAVYEQIQPMKTTLMVPDPPYRPDWAGRTERFNRDLLALVGEHEVHRIDALDPAAVRETLADLLGRSQRSDFAGIICPLGTKPQTLGVYSYIRATNDPAAIVYAGPLRHNHTFFSTGLGETWVLKAAGEK